MNLFMLLSFMQIEFGVFLLIVGFIGKKLSKSENKEIFFKKLKGYGILNIVLGIISGILQYLNENLMIVAALIYSIGVLFSVVFVIKNLFKGISRSNMKKSTKTITITASILILTLIFLGDSISDKLKIGFRKMDEAIKIGEEFLLYECTDSLHSEEKVYMTINDIRKDDYNGEFREGMLSTIMYFDLRYEGDEPIELVNKGDDMSTFDINLVTGSFSDLCSFQTKISTKSLKDKDYSEFSIAEDVNSEVIYTEYAKELPAVIEPGTVLKNLTHAVAVAGMGYDSTPLEDVDIELETYIKMNHEGKELREKII